MTNVKQPTRDQLSVALRVLVQAEHDGVGNEYDCHSVKCVTDWIEWLANDCPPPPIPDVVTLRDQIAMRVLPVLMGEMSSTYKGKDQVHDAYVYADMMIVQRGLK